MKFFRILAWFVLGSLLAFAAARSLSGFSWGSGDSGRGAMATSGPGADSYLPHPPFDDEASSLAFEVGVGLGYSTGNDYVSDRLDFDQSLLTNGLDPRLKPIQMSDSASGRSATDGFAIRQLT